MRKWILLLWLNVRWEEEAVGPDGVLDAPEVAKFSTIFCWFHDVAASQGDT